MKNTRIYGASDDLIQMDGGISDEIGVFDIAQTGVKFNCSDGTYGTITYNGEWLITVEQEGLGFVKLISGNDEIAHTDTDALGCASYSDVLIMNIDWIKVNGKKYH